MRSTRLRRPFRGPAAAMSLLEIMVVVLIMGIIAGVVTKVVVDKVERARVMKAKVEISSLRDAVQLFFVDQAFYPDALRDLVTQPNDPRIKNWPPSGYMPSIPLDPWGNRYMYIMPGVSQAFEIASFGADGMEGGDGFDADIKSWALSESAPTE